jgi:hypothetical protein
VCKDYFLCIYRWPVWVANLLMTMLASHLHCWTRLVECDQNLDNVDWICWICGWSVNQGCLSYTCLHQSSTILQPAKVYTECTKTYISSVQSRHKKKTAMESERVLDTDGCLWRIYLLSSEMVNDKMVLSLQVYNQFFSFHLICEFNAPCIYVLTYQNSIITLTKNQDSGAGGGSWGKH